MRRFSLIMGLLLAAPSLAPALEFKPAARFNVAGNYSSIPPKSAWGANGDLFLVPGLKQGDWMFLPLFGATGKSSETALAEDTFFVESYNFFAKPQIRYESGSLTYKLYGAAKRSINKETTTEVWSNGRYDYEEFAGGLGASWKSPAEGLGAVSLDLQGLHRTYMNFHEQGTASATGGKNYYSKDYDGLKVGVDLDAPKDASTPWSVGYTYLLKSYTDNYFVKKDGTLDLGKLRMDQLHRLDFNRLAGLSQTWSWNLNLGVDWLNSNQGFFDPTELRYNQDFYGYVAENAGLGLTWAPKGAEGPTLSPSYSLTNRNYTGRHIRNPDGKFTRGMQADIEHRLGLDGRWPLTSWVAVTSGVSYLSVLSNQAYVVRIKPTYDVFRAQLGVDLSY